MNNLSRKLINFTVNMYTNLCGLYGVEYCKGDSVQYILVPIVNVLIQAVL
jgi:hypothetical protein